MITQFLGNCLLPLRALLSSGFLGWGWPCTGLEVWSGTRRVRWRARSGYTAPTARPSRCPGGPRRGALLSIGSTELTSAGAQTGSVQGTRSKLKVGVRLERDAVVGRACAGRLLAGLRCAAAISGSVLTSDSTPQLKRHTESLSIAARHTNPRLAL